MQTMQDTIISLTLIIASLTAVHIATIVSGLEGKGEIIFAQMNWRFIMNCLFETLRVITLRDHQLTYENFSFGEASHLELQVAFSQIRSFIVELNSKSTNHS